MTNKKPSENLPDEWAGQGLPTHFTDHGHSLDLVSALGFIADHTTDRGAWAVARRALRSIDSDSTAGDDNPVGK